MENEKKSRNSKTEPQPSILVDLSGEPVAGEAVVAFNRNEGDRIISVLRGDFSALSRKFDDVDAFSREIKKQVDEVKKQVDENEKASAAFFKDHAAVIAKVARRQGYDEDANRLDGSTSPEGIVAGIKAFGSRDVTRTDLGILAVAGTVGFVGYRFVKKRYLGSVEVTPVIA
jgi:hypothetical protein